MNSPDQTNIVILGFMASGKTRIGKLVAERLGFHLFDVDALIERDQGMSIKELFEKKGEHYFRCLESDVLKTLLSRTHSVIVPGGGAPAFFDNAQVLKQLGHTFFLDASLPLIMKRLKKSQSRPLGQAHSPKDIERIKELYAFRRPIYLGLSQAIDVNHEDKQKTCDEIVERFHALKSIAELKKTIVWNLETHYPIIHCKGAVGSISDIISSLGLSDLRPAIVTTDRLALVFKDRLEAIKKSLKSPPALITFPDGEEHKTLSSISHIHDQMFALGLTRKSLIIALGGGNVGDVAGFAAAIFLRGIPFIQLPTTLLAMVDASIGGKTGVDLAIGKNLIGAFHNPKAVVIDPEFLSSLPKEDFACGMAEVIKHAIISDKALFEELKKDDLDISHMIEQALKVKADIVFADPQENNIRAHLNLGHTFAHAIEKVSGYRIKHGQAVAMGLVMAVKLAKKVGVLEEDFLEELIHLLNKFHLPTSLPDGFKKADLLLAMGVDKKRDNVGFKFILPKKIGEVSTQYVDEDDIFST